ncbi:MAG: RDD family protein [Deltaproteobacteria bacterium]
MRGRPDDAGTDFSRSIALQIRRRVPFRHEVKGNTARTLESEAVNPYAAPADTASAQGPSLSRGAQLATRSSRLGASLLDLVLYFGAAMPGVLVGTLLDSSLGVPKDDGTTQQGVGIVAGAVLTCLVLHAYQCYLIATNGQSLAKRWLRIRIVRENGEAPGFLKGVVLRSWVLALLRVVPMVGHIVGLVDTLMIFGDDQRCLHDRIAGTRVIQD